MILQTFNRPLSLSRPLVMGILNVTPDSFSDGRSFETLDAAVARAEAMAAEGADIIDVGGESTRPGSVRVSEKDEIGRVVPIIERIAGRMNVPISIDTSKVGVARAAVRAGAEIINDISGLRWDAGIANIAAETGAGLILMHSRGEFETLHSQEPVEDIFAEVGRDLCRALQASAAAGVKNEQIALDVGIGFGKTLKQNLELIANLDRLVDEFSAFPILVGASRKSFIGKILNDIPEKERLHGSLACAVLAVWNGAKMIRVHDVRETVQAVAIAEAAKRER
ncbi:dihydropteroate synthase [soil metagenome]